MAAAAAAAASEGFSSVPRVLEGLWLVVGVVGSVFVVCGPLCGGVGSVLSFSFLFDGFCRGRGGYLQLAGYPRVHPPGWYMCCE